VTGSEPMPAADRGLAAGIPAHGFRHVVRPPRTIADEAALPGKLVPESGHAPVGMVTPDAPAAHEAADPCRRATQPSVISPPVPASDVGILYTQPRVVTSED
jgi:hypothetical protein